MCLKENYSKDRTGKHLSDAFPLQNVLKQGDALTPLLFNFTLEYAIKKSSSPLKNQEGLELKTSGPGLC
jgi:hypothetical protein